MGLFNQFKERATAATEQRRELCQNKVAARAAARVLAMRRSQWQKRVLMGRIAGAGDSSESEQVSGGGDGKSGTAGGVGVTDHAWERRLPSNKALATVLLDVAMLAGKRDLYCHAAVLLTLLQTVSK